MGNSLELFSRAGFSSVSLLPSRYPS
jgi:hypothetical protein